MAKTKKLNKEIKQVGTGIQDRLTECNEAYTSGAFKYLRLLVHIIGAAQFIYAIYFWEFSLKIPHVKASWGGNLKFLTFLDVILQAIYHSVALLNDIFGSNAVNPQPIPFLRRLRDRIFTSLAFPIAHNVCVCFWVVYAFDRELIFPSALDPFFPSWLNHVVHTNVAMLMVMDLFTCFRRYPEDKSGVLVTSVTMFSYIVWLYIAKQYNGRWAYPLFDVVNLPMRYFLLFGTALVSLIFYFVGKYVNNVVWAPELKLLQQKAKLK